MEQGLKVELGPEKFLPSSARARADKPIRQSPGTWQAGVGGGGGVWCEWKYVPHGLNCKGWPQAPTAPNTSRWIYL